GGGVGLARGHRVAWIIHQDAGSLLTVGAGRRPRDMRIQITVAVFAAWGGCAPGGDPDGPTDIVALAPMGVPRAVHAQVRLRDGRVLVAGGFDDAGHDLATTELY